mgnify:CR=1 FL=1
MACLLLEMLSSGPEALEADIRCRFPPCLRASSKTALRAETASDLGGTPQANTFEKLFLRVLLSSQIPLLITDVAADEYRLTYDDSLIGQLYVACFLAPHLDADLCGCVF